MLINKAGKADALFVCLKTKVKQYSRRVTSKSKGHVTPYSHRGAGKGDIQPAPLEVLLQRQILT